MKASHLLSSLITTAIFLAAAAPAAGAGAFVGTYKNDELTVAFLADKGGYTGTVKLRNQTFPLSATERSGALEGAFLSGESQFAFKATLDGESLTFTTDGP